MRKRIEQLEAQLQAQSTAKSETTSTDAAERLETARQGLLATGNEPVVSSASATVDCDRIHFRPEGGNSSLRPF